MEELKRLKTGPVEFVVSIPIDKKTGKMVLDKSTLEAILLEAEKAEKSGIVREVFVRGYVGEDGKIRISAKDFRQALFGLSDKEKLAPHGIVTQIYPNEDIDDYGRPISYYSTDPRQDEMMAEAKEKLKKERDWRKDWDRFLKSEAMATPTNTISSPNGPTIEIVDPIKTKAPTNQEKYKTLRQSIFHIFLESTIKIGQYRIDSPDLTYGLSPHGKQLFVAAILEKYRNELTNIISNLQGTDSFDQMCKFKNGDTWINSNADELKQLLAMGNALGLIEVQVLNPESQAARR